MYKAIVLIFIVLLFSACSKTNYIERDHRLIQTTDVSNVQVYDKKDTSNIQVYDTKVYDKRVNSNNVKETIVIDRNSGSNGNNETVIINDVD